MLRFNLQTCASQPSAGTPVASNLVTAVVTSLDSHEAWLLGHEGSAWRASDSLNASMGAGPPAHVISSALRALCEGTSAEVPTNLQS
jgi:hypothetical protein